MLSRSVQRTVGSAPLPTRWRPADCIACSSLRLIVFSLACRSQPRRLVACPSRGGKGQRVVRAACATWSSRPSGLVRPTSFCTDRPMQALLLRLATQLPPPVRQFATPARIGMLVQFLMFGTVGMVGFLVDTATVYALRRSLGLYGAGMAAYVVAATVTWMLNRTMDLPRPGQRPGASAVGALSGGQPGRLHAQPRHLRAAGHLRCALRGPAGLCRWPPERSPACS